MTTRRDFLKSLGAALGAIAVVPASALATVQRLGTVPEWVPRVHRLHLFSEDGAVCVGELRWTERRDPHWRVVSAGFLPADTRQEARMALLSHYGSPPQ